MANSNPKWPDIIRLPKPMLSSGTVTDLHADRLAKDKKRRMDADPLGDQAMRKAEEEKDCDD